MKNFRRITVNTLATVGVLAIAWGLFKIVQCNLYRLQSGSGWVYLRQEYHRRIEELGLIANALAAYENEHHQPAPSLDQLLDYAPSLAEVITSEDGKAKYLFNFEAITRLGVPSTTPDPEIVVTDVDSIDRSRLNSCFRESDAWTGRAVLMSDTTRTAYKYVHEKFVQTWSRVGK